MKTIGLKKLLLGTGVSITAIALLAPLAFWFVALWIDRAFGLVPIVVSPASQILAAIAIPAGVFWASWAHGYIIFVGKGVPLEIFGRALHPTKVLVTTGPYAYTRNPLALALLLILLGVDFLEGSVSGLVLIPATGGVMCIYLIRFEEKALQRRFGADYEDYRRHVPLLIPRLSPYIHKTGDKP